MEHKSPDELYKQLFDAVQMERIFPDSKTFVDCIPKEPASEILYKYYQSYKKESFDLWKFVKANFIFPQSAKDAFITDKNDSPEQHIEKLWSVLQRNADKEVEGSSLIPLPYQYVVPGGRFGEVYYWDSYFTMLGLEISGKTSIIEDMLDNFAHLIDNIGHIPNGNRSYFLSRSQPPFFSLMVQLLARNKSKYIFRKYEDSLRKEYKFWMSNRYVNIYGMTLNRYFDNKPAPREESFLEDKILLKKSKREKFKLYEDIRAACESGWDFSSRWLSDGEHMESINTTDIIPIDLNCLLYGLEDLLLEITEDSQEQERLNDSMDNRLEFLELSWNPEKGIYEDFNFKTLKRTNISSLACMYPLYFKIAPKENAALTAKYIEDYFLCDGGVVTTPNNTGQQWDAPNGWAPLQWITVIGLDNYGFKELARTIANRWIELNNKVFKDTGKFVEKYNVEDINLEAGGAEYPVQDGFGWTNGVYLALKKYLLIPDS